MKNINEMYFREDYRWWDSGGDNTNALLRCFINPIRFAYFKRVVDGEVRPRRCPRKILDVGCGGGFLAEEFARIEFNVTGIEPSGRAVLAARKHAAEGDLRITYLEGYGEALPFKGDSFDFVACCDVLEHVDDVAQVLREVFRVLRDGGVFFYDTINRTLFSKLVVIKVAQDWSCTAWEEPHTHDWRKFIKPAELTAAMQRCGLVNQETRGISSDAGLLSGLVNVRRRAKGRISRYEMGAGLRLHESDDMSASYMGYAIKERRDGRGGV